MKKYIGLCIALIIIKLCNISFLTKSLNISRMVSEFASNLYTYDEGVATNDVEVIDYVLMEKDIYITPMNQEVVLPISGIVSDVGSNYIEIQTNNASYKIYDIKPKFLLYQYYKKGMILGESKQCRIETYDFQAIVSHLVIRYEAI